MAKRRFLLLATALSFGCGPMDDNSEGPRRDASDDAFDDSASRDDPRMDAAVLDDTSPPADTTHVATPEEIAIAGQLQGAFLEIDCASEEIELQFCHAKEMAVQNLMLQFGGEPGKSYSVVLGVWGVVEAAKYEDGTAVGEHFYIGGHDASPSIGTSGLPADYGLTVGTQTYYLNANDVGGEHYTYGIEYVTPPITILGGSTLVLFVHSPDDMINTNHMDSSATLHPPPGLQPKLDQIKSQPLQGQFIYLEAQSVTVEK
jgi:hypothetical protein